MRCEQRTTLLQNDHEMFVNRAKHDQKFQLFEKDIKLC